MSREAHFSLTALDMWASMLSHTNVFSRAYNTDRHTRPSCTAALSPPSLGLVGNVHPVNLGELAGLLFVLSDDKRGKLHTRYNCRENRSHSHRCKSSWVEDNMAAAAYFNDLLTGIFEVYRILAQHHCVLAIVLSLCSPRNRIYHTARPTSWSSYNVGRLV